MSDVKRYTVHWAELMTVPDCLNAVAPVGTTDHTVVLASDYDALAAAHASLRAENERIGKAAQDIAAELARITALHDDAWKKYNEWRDEAESLLAAIKAHKEYVHGLPGGAFLSGDEKLWAALDGHTVQPTAAQGEKHE